MTGQARGTRPGQPFDGLCCAKTRSWRLTWRSRSLGRSAVLGDEAVQNLPTLDPGGDVDGLAGLPLRGLLLKGLVRPVAVIVPGVFGQDLAEMPLTEDQHVIQALSAQRAHGPLRECVAPHHRLHLIRMIGTGASG